jgi:hypothetical protein
METTEKIVEAHVRSVKGWATIRTSAATASMRSTRWPSIPMLITYVVKRTTNIVLARHMAAQQKITG